MERPLNLVDLLIIDLAQQILLIVLAVLALALMILIPAASLKVLVRLFAASPIAFQ